VLTIKLKHSTAVNLDPVLNAYTVQARHIEAEWDGKATHDISAIQSCLLGCKVE